jgi:hypothetical protein
LSFAFGVKIPDFDAGVVAIVSVQQSKDGRSEIEIFYRKQAARRVWVQSAEFEARKTEYNSVLRKTLASIRR